MLYISATLNPKGKTGLTNVLINDILFLEFDMVERWVIVHTESERFFVPGTLNYWVESLKNSGYNFERVDRNSVVNVPKIKRMESSFCWAYFSEDGDGKKVTMSQKYFKKIYELVATSSSTILI